MCVCVRVCVPDKAHSSADGGGLVSENSSTDNSAIWSDKSLQTLGEGEREEGERERGREREEGEDESHVRDKSSKPLTPVKNKREMFRY